jgi:hypothetical protein
MPSTEQRTKHSIMASQALAIAEADALSVYENLSRYHIEIRLERSGWHIAYHLREQRVAGGGPTVSETVQSD